MGREPVDVAHHPEHPLAGNTEPRQTRSRAQTLRVPRPSQGDSSRSASMATSKPVRDRGLGPRRFLVGLSGGLLPGFHGVERVQNGQNPRNHRTDPLEAVGQTRAGRGGGTHRRDLRRPKGPDVSVLASSSSTCMINSPIRFMAMSSSAFTGSPLRSLSEASIPAIAFSPPLLEPENLRRRSCRDKS